MVIYILTRLFSLIFVGSTREILIIETKQWLEKNIKNIICNEIIKGDKYLTEDRVISTVTMQERNNEISYIDRNVEVVKQAIKSYEGKVLEEVTWLGKKENNKDKKILDTDVGMSKTEKILYGYEPKYKDVISNVKIIDKIKNTKNNSYMIQKIYMVDGSTSIDKNIFNVSKLLKINNKIKKDNSKPQILIYHTHASEGYIDSKKRESDTVVGVGEYLRELLEENYGYKVLHIKKKFDVVNNKWNRNAYDTALPYIKDVLKKNPTIEVVIDLHRDSGREKVVTKIDNITVAKLMYFNGVCRSNIGPRKEIPNKNLLYNLSFSMNMQTESMMMYPGLTKKIYLKGYRYNMHVAKKAMLVEVGNNKNTVLEAKNSMVPFSKILNKVLTTQ